MKSLLVLLFALVAVSYATRVFPERDTAVPLPRDWMQTRRLADVTATRKVHFLLPIPDKKALEEKFWAIATPGSPEYRQYLSLDELRPLCENPAAVERVQRFLHMHGITESKVVPTGDWVSAELPLFIMEKMFNVTFKVYRHIPTRQLHTATLDAYSVPAALGDFVSYITPVTGLPDVETPKARPAPAPESQVIDPEVIRARYNVSSTLVGTASNNSHAVAEFQDQNYDPNDLKKFFTKYVPYSTADTVAKVIGYNDPNDPKLEASLDVEYIMGVAPGITTWFYGMKSFDFYSDLTNWLNELNTEPAIPWVHSISYGSQGDYPSQSYINRQDSEYQKLGMRGASIVFASGDSGAECEDRCKQLDVSYPAESIYVTAVGATRFLHGNSGPEGAVQAFKSGGGFSRSIPLPDFQKTEVQGYLQQPVKFPPPTAFNSSNRANPDFAALGSEHFQVVNGGFTVSVGGTSASSPTFSAIMSLLNDNLLNNNKPTLGFLNPTLYNWATTTKNSFFDVTDGNNYEGCAGACGKDYEPGFTCTPGYDAVTGMGTPNFAVLVTLL